MADDPTDAEQPAGDGSGASALFDIRSVIGGLFLLYGLVLVVAGLVDGAAASEKAAGIDINIWTGLGMAVFGASFLAWMRARPVRAAAAVKGEGDEGRDG